MGRASENTGNADIADFDPLSPKGTVYIQNTRRSGPRDEVGGDPGRILIVTLSKQIIHKTLSTFW